MLNKLFKNKIKVTEKELGELFYYWANSCTKDLIDNHEFLPEKINKNNLYNDLLILNMFLITQFTPQEKIPYDVYESMYRSYWSIFSDQYSQKEMIEIKTYQNDMFETYLEIMKKYINENYVEKLANYFMYHVTKEQHSSYSFEVVEIATAITGLIKFMPDWLNEYKIINN
jgi:lysophospholipase L1-like esterase